MKNKVVGDCRQALADLRDRGILYDGCTVMVGGFGLCGIPEQLIIALRDTGVKEMTCVSNNAGVDDWGLGLLLQTRQIRKMVSSYVGENDTFEKQYLSGQLEVEFNPQGTLAERIRAGGAGIPAFYTPSGAGTMVAQGKPSGSFAPPLSRARVNHEAAIEREYVLETGLYADLSLVKAFRADPFGNLVYRKTARNFSPMMATAAAFVVAEVEELVGLGEIPPDSVHTPGAFVDRIVRTVSEKRIEQRTVQS
ncbi:MAG: CoA transferase subunit A [Phycisphaeraceae bacterium]|nr:CoA transferase subunit A [Phycisphaeraceae bacterium]